MTEAPGRHLPAPLQAWGMFTILPAPVGGAPSGRDARRIIASLPWVGLALGVLAGLASGAISWLSTSALLSGVAGLAVLAGATGGLHLDGLADTADGLGSRRDAEQALAVMKRSDIGPMGVVTIVFALLVDVAALSQLDPGPRAIALVIAPMVARLSVVEATGRWVPSARPGGFGALFAGTTRPVTFVLDAVAVLVVAVGIGVAFRAPWSLLAWLAGSIVVTWLIAFGWRRHLVRRLGGLTGDTFGSLIEVSQAVFLILIALGPIARAIPV